MKKFLSLLLCLCMVLSLCIVPGFAEEATESEFYDKKVLDLTQSSFGKDAQNIGINKMFDGANTSSGYWQGSARDDTEYLTR